MRISFALGAVTLLLTAQPGLSQATPTVSFASYYRCDQSREERVDAIVSDVFGPVFDRHVAAGHLSSWFLSVHSMGGEWRRLIVWAGGDRDVMMDARAQIEGELRSARNAAATAEFFDICPSHDDYIWTRVSGSESPPAGAPAAMASVATYFACDLGREGLADEIFRSVFAPILDRQVAAGEISSWTWLAHDVGGMYRRVFVLDGQGHKALLGAIDRFQAAANAQHSNAFRALGSACSIHQDYLWSVAIRR